MGSKVDNPQNIFKILIATDIHLGYQEKNPERGGDTFNTFEEILELAVAENVDFILLGGDLFHENKPSRNSILRCMELVKKYTFGDKQVHFDFLSDPSVNFPHLKNPTVNYLDPNLNISIPVFSIHGNHDDPSGLGQHSPLEVLSTTGLINYFGTIDNLNEINVSPLLMEKGQTKLAIYGLSSVKDERLHRLFREEKVRMFRPKEEMDSWFNILVLHQNHQKHSLTNYIPEHFLDPFLNLVIWGHEHECLIHPQKSTDDGFFVIQPGSSVATSLCAGEATPKHVGLLEVDSNRKMRVTPHLLETVRPFVFEDFSFNDCDLPKTTNNEDHNFEKAVELRVKDMIEQAKQLVSGHPRQPTKPLIRLRVEYTDESQMFNVNRFGFKFIHSVANPDSLILFRKFRKDAPKMDGGQINQDAMDAVFNADVSQIKVEDLVKQYFDELENDTHRLQLLSERGLAHAVNQFVEKDYREAINLIFANQVDKTAKYLKNLKVLDLESIEDTIENYHAERQTSEVTEEEEAIAALGQKYNPGEAKGAAAEARGKAAKARGGGGAAAAAADSDFDSDTVTIDDDDDDIEICETRRGKGGATSRGSRRGTSKRGGTYAAQNIHPEKTLGGNEKPARGSNRARRSYGKERGTTAATSRTPSILESFPRTSSRISTSQRSKRGAVFDDDSDME